MTNLLQQLLEDFVFADCRLADHPKVRAAVRWKEGQALIHSTRSSAQSRANIQLYSSDDSVTRTAFEKSSYTVKTGFSQEMKSCLVAPIPGLQGPAGVVSFDSSEQDFFRESHLGLAQCLAALIAYIKLHIETPNRRPSEISLSLGKGLREVREEIGLTQSLLAARIGTSRIALSRWESGGQPPSKGPLLRWCNALGLLMRGTPTVVSVVEFGPRLLEMLQRDPEYLHSLSPDQFEHFVAERLDRMGFDVKLTGGLNTRDGGIDLIAVPKGGALTSFLLAGQVKHHRDQQKTGRAVVDRLLSWKDSQFTMGLLVTNTGFSRDAIWVAAQEKHKGFLRLRDFTDLKRWIADNFWTEEEWREIPSTVMLAPGVTIAVPKARLTNSLHIWPLDRFD